jgi:hypothetical protein
MVHIVRVDGKIFGISDKHLDPAMRDYSNGNPNYDVLKRKLVAARIENGATAYLAELIGYLDFDTIKDGMPVPTERYREAVRRSSIGGLF